MCRAKRPKAKHRDIESKLICNKKLEFFVEHFDSLISYRVFSIAVKLSDNHNMNNIKVMIM